MIPTNQDSVQKIAVDVEVLKKDIANVNNIQGKLDNAIEKLTDVSTSIKSMLAVHEQKITQSEKTEEILFDKVRERGEELDIVYRDLQRDISQTEKRLLLEIKSLKSDINERVNVLERWRWLILGGAIVVGYILAKNMPAFLSTVIS
jgi:chromosome segregation ATPase